MRHLVPPIAVAVLCCLGPMAAHAATAGNQHNIDLVTSNADPDNVTFVVIGDSLGGDDVFAALVGQINDLGPDFVWHLGDFAKSGRPAEYDAHLKLAAAIKAPLVQVPGDHDVRESLDTYLEYFGLRNWSFDLGDIRFIGLDNSSYRFDTETLDFAATALDTDKDCFIAFHTPPHVGRWACHSMRADEDNGRGREMIDLIKDSPVRSVFMGHIHIHDTMEIRGVEYNISGGGGSELHDRYGFGQPEHGFLLVRVINKNSTIRWISLKSD